MGKRTVALLGAVVALAIGAAPATAAVSPNQATPGTPGTKQCTGQTVAFIAQIGAEADVHGVGNVASIVGLSVQEVQALISAYCAS